VNIEALSLDQMRVALTVAEIGSFSGAARRLGRKQSALSYAVATLENQLGVSLFDRSDGRRPKLTEIGHILLREMEAVIRRVDEIKKQSQAAANGLENELSITIDSFYPNNDLVALLDGFAERFPTVQLRLDVESMGAVQRNVLDGTAVLGIIGSFPNLPPGLIGDPVTRVARIPVASPEHPLAAKISNGVRVPTRVLLDHIQIVVSDRSDLTKGRDFSVYTGRTWRVNELALKRDLLIAGLGWGYMPEHLIEREIAAGSLCPLRVEGLRDKNTVALLVVRKRDVLLGPAARWILSRLVQTTDEETAKLGLKVKDADRGVLDPHNSSSKHFNQVGKSRLNARQARGKVGH
jgi:DNA-binding transcriptional LysR family regulator